MRLPAGAVRARTNRMHNVEAPYRPLAEGTFPVPGAAQLASASHAAQTDPDADVAAPAVPRRPLNVRLLVILVAAALVVLVGVHFLHAWQVARTASLFLTRAEAARAEGDLTQTARLLATYLRFEKDDREAWVQFALVVDDAAKLEGAKRDSINLMERVVWSDEQERPELRARLAERLLEFGRFYDARIHLGILADDEPENPKWQSQIAECWIGEGNSGRAAESLYAAIKGAPREFRYYGRLAGVLSRELNRPDDAEKLLNEMVQRNRNAPDALLVRARYRRDQGRLDQALIDAKNAYALAPDSRDVLLLVASLLAGHTDPSQVAPHFSFREVQERIQRARNSQPDDLDLTRAAVQLELLAGQPERAEDELQTAIAAHPEDAALRWLLADVLLRRNKISEARTLLKDLRDRRLVPSLTAYLDARIAIAEGEWLAARRHLETISLGREIPPYVQAQIQWHLAACYGRLGQRERQFDAFEKALSANPVLEGVKVERAAALATAGRIDEALAQYEVLRDQPGVALAIARLLLVQNAVRSPDRQDWDKVEAALNEAGTNPAHELEVLLLRASMLVARDDAQAARELVEQAAARHPRDLRLVTALADLHQLAGAPQEALAALDTAERQFGRRAAIDLARARHWLRRGADEARRELPLLAERRAGLPEPAQAVLLSGLASAWRQLNDTRQAAALLELAAGLEPDDLQLWMQILDLAIRDRDDQRARRALAEIRRIDGETSVSWLLGEAARQMMLVRQGQRDALGRARELLDAASRRGNSARIALAQAEIAELDGNESAAVVRYQEAIDRGERSPEVFRRVVELLYRQRQYFDAEHMIEKFRALEIVDVSDVFGRLAAEVLIHTNRTEQAVDMARRAVAGSETPAESVWLAQVLWAAGRTAEAESTLRTAIRQAPERPEPYIVLVALLARGDRAADAATAIHEMQQALPADQSHLAVAQCYETIGQADQAADHYRQALETSGADPAVLWSAGHFYLRNGRLENAEPLLRQLCDPNSRTPPALLAGARRGLALLLAQQGGYPQFEEAVALLDANVAVDGGSPADLRVKSQVLATRPLRSAQREALSLFLRLSDRVTLSAEDQFQMIRLQVSLGRWNEARGGMHALLAGGSTNVDHLAYCASQMLDRGEIRGSVEDWIKALVALEPQSFRSVELQARRGLLLGNHADASKLLHDWLTGGPDGPPADPARLRQAAAALTGYAARLERSGQTLVAERLAGEAEALYRRLVDLAPAEMPELIRFLARRWRVAEALNLCETSWNTAPVDAMALVCLDLLRTGRIAPNDARRIRGWLESARQQHPDSAEVAFQLAMVANAQGDYDTAERSYRATLELAPQAIAACNDLAWLLAVRDKPRAERDEALRLINRAIDLAGPLDYLLETRASVYLALDDPLSARRDLEQAIEDRSTPGRQFRLALAHFKASEKDKSSRAGDERAARSAMEQAISGGLHAGVLHPLEVPDYERLRSLVGGRP
ncbi:MAG TPA: tetratricopeptide repeat protein [Planctomycetaceae bacterium]|nr:tetratricopeptide repeat protein [Planctomycetaceae bacterium]